MTEPLTPERLAALRAQNAARPATEWPDRYLVDELLDEIEAQQGEIERLTGDFAKRLDALERRVERRYERVLRGEA